jgi:solute carrier family 25 carnitine/acylcarnitine transporter 20/29
MGGGMAGVTSWAFTMPCDVIKSHIQSLSLGSSSSGCGAATRKSAEFERRWLAVAKWGVEKHGVNYFFRGFGPAVLRAFPVSAVVFTVYEFIMTNLDKYDESIGGVYH